MKNIIFVVCFICAVAQTAQAEPTLSLRFPMNVGHRGAGFEPALTIDFKLGQHISFMFAGGYNLHATGTDNSGTFVEGGFIAHPHERWSVGVAYRLQLGTIDSTPRRLSAWTGSTVLGLGEYLLNERWSLVGYLGYEMREGFIHDVDVRDRGLVIGFGFKFTVNRH